MKRLTKQEITPMVAAEAISTEVNEYAKLKVEQFKHQQNEVSNTNEKA
jgi:hypothetical protein